MVPLQYILRSLGRRKLRTVMTILGVALVVAIYAAMSAVADTMIRSFRSTGAPDEVVLIQAGALSVDFSTVQRETLTWVQTQGGVATSGERPLVSPELCLGSVAEVGGEEHDVSLRGVTDIAPAVYGQVRLGSGAWPEPGHRATVGRAMATKLGLSEGDSFEVEGEQWTVVGILDGGGRVYDQEIWVDLDDLAAAANRTSYSSYTVRTESPAAAVALTEAVSANRRFPLRGQLAADFYARAGGMSIAMATMGQLIAIIIALGAAFGGMNTMYSAVAGRRREIGVLRALGYRRGAVLLAFLLESLALCVIGGLIGVVLGQLLSMVPFDVPFLPASRVTLGAPQIAWSLVLAVMVGLFGGGLPALQASRIPVVDALR